MVDDKPPKGMWWIPVRECNQCDIGRYLGRNGGFDYYSCGHHTKQRDVLVPIAEAQALGYGKD